jgi:hypothetical protein
VSESSEQSIANVNERSQGFRQRSQGLSEQPQSPHEQPKSFLESIKPQKGDKTPCCRFVKALIKWIWDFLITQRELVKCVATAIVVAWGVCIFWGYYFAGVWVFNPTHYYALPEREALLIIAAGIVGLMTIIYALIMQRARSERVDCSLKQTHIEALSKLWLGEERLKAQTEAANENWRKEQMAIVEAQAASRILTPRTDLVADFVQSDLAIFLPKFSTEEFQMLRFLLNHLEKSGLIPSVASIYQRDYDVRQFRYCNGSKDIAITSDGRTSYEILAQTTLLDHSIRVARNIIEEIKSKTNTYSILIPQAVLAALAHDIGKIQKFDSMSIGDNVAAKNDHPYLSEMVLKETFPNYYDLESLTAVVREHHLPIDKNSTIYAVALKEADKKARRQEMSAWFKRHYGTDTHPDPYITVNDEDDNNNNQKGNGNRRTKTNANRRSVSANDETDGVRGIEKTTSSDKTKKNNDLGEQYAPIIDEKRNYEKGLKALPFDLDRFEMVLLGKIAGLPVTIEQSKKSAFVSRLEIKAIPYREVWLVAFASIVRAFRSTIVDTGLEDDEYAQMAHYAINEWRMRDIVVNIGTGYSTRKFQYSNDGREEIVALTPFEPDRLALSMRDKMDEAKRHPLYALISDLKYASGK